MDKGDETGFFFGEGEKMSLGLMGSEVCVICTIVGIFSESVGSNLTRIGGLGGTKIWRRTLSCGLLANNG